METTPQQRHTALIRQMDHWRDLGRDPERLRQHLTHAFIGHIEHRPTWPTDERAQHLIRQGATDALIRRPALLRDARRAWYYPLGYPSARLRTTAEILIEAGKRRATRLRARQAHRADTGYTSPEHQSDRPPSGCAVCGRPARYHGRVWHRSTQRYETHVPPDNAAILARMRHRRAARTNEDGTR